MVEEMKMHHAARLEEVLAQAASLGKRDVTFIPSGISAIVSP